MSFLRSRNDVITYTVNKAVNTDLYISVQNGEVVVKAPWYLSKEKIQNTVEEKKKWILEKIKEYEESTKEVVEEKNMVMLLGKEYSFQVCYKRINVPSLEREGTKIKVTLPNKYKRVNNDEIVEMVMDKMYETVARQEIEKIMEKVRIKLGFAPEDYQIKKMKNRIAKYNEDKTITIHPEIVKYREEIIEYVVLHEYCHLKYKTHAKGFEKLLVEYMPEYRKIENEIKEVIY